MINFDLNSRSIGTFASLHPGIGRFVSANQALLFHRTTISQRLKGALGELADTHIVSMVWACAVAVPTTKLNATSRALVKVVTKALNLILDPLRWRICVHRAATGFVGMFLSSSINALRFADKAISKSRAGEAQIPGSSDRSKPKRPTNGGRLKVCLRHIRPHVKWPGDEEAVR